METEPSVNGVPVDSWSTGIQNTRNRLKTSQANDILAQESEAMWNSLGAATRRAMQESHVAERRETSAQTPLKTRSEQKPVQCIRKGCSKQDSQEAEITERQSKRLAI